MSSCAECGFDLIPNTRFCTNCGARIGKSPPPTVTDLVQDDIHSLEREVASGLGRHPLKSIGALLLMVSVIGAAFWVVSYQSADGIQIATGNGEITYRTGLLGYAEFDVSVTISSPGAIGATISQVSFGLTIDSVIPFSTVPADGWTFNPGQSIQYVLKFTSYDSTALQYISQGGSHQVTVTIRAWSSSGAYSGWILSSATNTWNWNSPS